MISTTMMRMRMVGLWTNSPWPPNTLRFDTSVQFWVPRPSDRSASGHHNRTRQLQPTPPVLPPRQRKMAHRPRNPHRSKSRNRTKCMLGFSLGGSFKQTCNVVQREFFFLNVPLEEQRTANINVILYNRLLGEFPFVLTCTSDDNEQKK